MADVDRHVTLMDELEQTFTPRLADFLMSVMDEVLVSVQRSGGTVGLPPRKSTLQAHLTDLWTAAANTVGSLTDEDLGLKASPYDRFAQEYADAYGVAQLDRIGRTTTEQIRQGIIQAQANGMSFEDTVRALTEAVPSISQQRAQTIVRTESHAASQYASQRRVTVSGVAATKMWNTVGDERVRDFGASGYISQFNHRAMQGVSVPVDGRFAVPTLGGGVEMLLFPGDPSGSAGNIINCRCVQTYERKA